MPSGVFKKYRMRLYQHIMPSPMHPDWGNKHCKSWLLFLKFICPIVQYNVRLACQSYRFHVMAIFSKMHWTYTVHEYCVHTKTRRGEFSNEKWRVKVYDDPDNLSFDPLIKLYTVKNVPLALGFKFVEEFINVVVQVFSTWQLQENTWGYKHIIINFKIKYNKTTVQQLFPLKILRWKICTILKDKGTTDMYLQTKRDAARRRIQKKMKNLYLVWHSESTRKKIVLH